MLRASSSFEPFGVGGPGEEDAAASLGALVAWFFFIGGQFPHRRLLLTCWTLHFREEGFLAIGTLPHLF